jgi:non-heme chloroperoxidase
MRYFTVGAENGADIRIYYQDQGSGLPVALIHGYRSTRTPWGTSRTRPAGSGHRVIAYDRRGFGNQPTHGGV